MTSCCTWPLTANLSIRKFMYANTSAYGTCLSVLTMARLCSRLICTVTLFSVLSVTLNVSDAKPLSLTRSKRQSDCNNTYSQCECGVQYRAVLDKVGTSTVTSRVEYKLCRMTCPSGEQQPLPRLTKLTASASSYQLQCSCKAGFQYHQRTGCCRNACHNLNCKSYQKCSVRLSAVYCEDTCTGYPNCGQGQECYLRAGTTCHYVGGVTVCPQIAACRYTDPCFQCKSYQRCIRGLRNVICEDTCEGYPGCKKGEECYLYRPSFCYFGSCQNIAACRRIDPCATVQCTYYQSCHVHNGTGYCRDSCFRNGPCHSNRQCQLVDQNCNGRLPCPKRAVCGKPACAGYTYTLRTNRRQSIVNYPQRRITSCGQFEGSFTLIATNGLCIKVTADLGSRDTKSGELIRVHDGDINSRQLFQGSSLRGVNVVSSSYIITVVFKSPDIELSNGLGLRIELQGQCNYVSYSQLVTTPRAQTSVLTATSPPITEGATACLDACPTPRIGCVLYRLNEGDCCPTGEVCFV